MNLEFQEYRAKKILNVHKHIDGAWFWCKYTAHPYIGCRCGCEFCYSRGEHYLGRRDPNTFDTLIRVKINAVERLRGELFGRDREIIVCGDWQQPAEKRYRLSRGMLEVVRDYEFPLLIIERSALVTRDLDLISEINQQAWAGAIFSFSHVDPVLKRAFEPRSPGLQRRLRAMATLANAGITVGTALMPVIPFLGDDEKHLEETIRATKDHGGTFVLVGGLTMDGVQAKRTLAAALRVDPDCEARWRKFYNWRVGGKPNYGPSRGYSARLGMRVRELCTKHGLSDRMPRYIAPGPLAVNKRIAEKLFLKVYELELAREKNYRIWAYRKAAWTVDEMDENIAEIYHARGEAGLRELPGIGKSLAGVIARWLRERGEEEIGR